MGIAEQQKSLDLARHLRSLRIERKMSLQDFADRSGVSRAALSRLENGEVSPTAETLGKLATALAVPISQVIAPLEQRFDAMVTRDRQGIWRDAENGFVRRSLSPPSGQLTLELIECELGAGRTIAYAEPSVPGQEHHLALLSGALRVTVGGEPYDMRPGDCLRYRLFGASRFETRDRPARYIIALA